MNEDTVLDRFEQHYGIKPKASAPRTWEVNGRHYRLHHLNHVAALMDDVLARPNSLLHFNPAVFDSLYNPNRTEIQLRQFLAFGIAVAGKNSASTMKAMDKFLSLGKNEFGTVDPLRIAASHFTRTALVDNLRECGFGCQTQRATSFLDAFYKIEQGKVSLGLSDARELETIKGVSFKTSRFFLLYSRANVEHAALDTHVWKMVRDHYPDAPEKVPSSRTKYEYWERKFMDLRDVIPACKGMSYAELDFYGWDGKRQGTI